VNEWGGPAPTGQYPDDSAELRLGAAGLGLFWTAGLRSTSWARLNRDWGFPGGDDGEFPWFANANAYLQLVVPCSFSKLEANMHALVLWFD
jgi:hypothetical protein